MVRIIKSITSEQSFVVEVAIKGNTAQHSTRDATADFSVEHSRSLHLRLLLPPEKQETAVFVTIFPDTILESVEDFALTIQKREDLIPGYAPYTPGPITTTLVQILDTFCEFKFK